MTAREAATSSARKPAAELVANRGAALLLAATGFACFSLGDAVVKSMSGQWPAPAVSALRYAMGALLLAALVGMRHGSNGFTLPHPLLQLGRGAAVALASVCFFIAAMRMPLADATAIQFTSPLLTALLSVMLLAERPPRAIWAAIALASVGVVLVLRPNLLHLGASALLPFGTAFGMAMLIMLNRKAAGTAPALLMQLLIAMMAAPILIVVAAVLAAAFPNEFAFSVPTLAVVAKCGVVALTSSLGHLLVYRATELASAAVVAPVTYVQLLVATLLGWLWFGDAPDAQAVAGALLIVASGLLIWRAAKAPITR